MKKILFCLLASAQLSAGAVYIVNDHHSWSGKLEAVKISQESEEVFAFFICDLNSRDKKEIGCDRLGRKRNGYTLQDFAEIQARLERKEGREHMANWAILGGSIILGGGAGFAHRAKILKVKIPRIERAERSKGISTTRPAMAKMDADYAPGIGLISGILSGTLLAGIKNEFLDSAEELQDRMNEMADMRPEERSWGRMQFTINQQGELVEEMLTGIEAANLCSDEQRSFLVVEDKIEGIVDELTRALNVLPQQ